MLKLKCSSSKETEVENRRQDTETPLTNVGFKGAKATQRTEKKQLNNQKS